MHLWQNNIIQKYCQLPKSCQLYQSLKSFYIACSKATPTSVRVRGL